jgi:hypothetical protein
LDKEGFLDPSQYGFTQDAGCDDLLLTTSMIYEDAHTPAWERNPLLQ